MKTRSTLKTELPREFSYVTCFEAFLLAHIFGDLLLRDSLMKKLLEARLGNIEIAEVIDHLSQPLAVELGHHRGDHAAVKNTKLSAVDLEELLSDLGWLVEGELLGVEDVLVLSVGLEEDPRELHHTNNIDLLLQLIHLSSSK